MGPMINEIVSVLWIWHEKHKTHWAQRTYWNIPKYLNKSPALHGLFFSKKDFLAGMLPLEEVVFVENVSRTITMLPRNSWLLIKYFNFLKVT